MEIYERNRNISWKDLGDHIIILDSSSKKQVHHLEDTGAFIWKHIDGKTTSEQLLSLILNEFNISKEEATSDLNAFLTDLKNQSLIHHVS